LLFDGGALAAERGALADGEGGVELGFGKPGEGEVEVVATEEEVPPDGGTGEVDAVTLAVDADESEVGGAAADIANQDELPIEEVLAGLGEVIRNPGIEGGGGLFEQGEALDAGKAGGFDGEFAGFLVEGGRHGEDDFVLGEGRMGVLPGVAEGREQAGGGFDGTVDAPAFGGVPGEDFGGAVDVGVGEPAFGGVNEAGRGKGTLFAGVDANNFRLADEDKRREGALGLDDAFGDRLGDFEDVYRGEISAFGFLLADIGEGGVGGAKVNAKEVSHGDT
jgi:hypothetical protein